LTVGGTAFVPAAGDFCGSVCALKLHALKTATRIGTSDFIVFRKRRMLGVI